MLFSIHSRHSFTRQNLAIQMRVPVRVVAIIFVSLAAGALSTAHAQINDIRTGQPIPGTQGITLGPGLDLSDWNSAGHNLRYGDFSNNGIGGVNLTGDLFDNSWLDNAEFYGATLTNANFPAASLTGTDYSFATLTNANFTQANLAGAFLDYTTLAGANLTGANISRRQLSVTRI